MELYEDAECLWNFRHALYKNKNARDAASRNIILQLGIPGFDTNDLKNTIKNIRSTYTQELCKIKRAIKSGMSPDEEYVSHLLWFKTANRFLQKVINTREHFSNHVSIQFNFFKLLLKTIIIIIHTISHRYRPPLLVYKFSDSQPEMINFFKACISLFFT